MLLLRALVRILSLVLLVVLALAGLAVAVFCLQGGAATLSLPNGADLLNLPEARDEVASWLSSLEAPGSLALLGLAIGTGAVLLGLALLAGVFVPRRERLVSSGRGDDALSARRRPLAQAATALAEQAEGISDARVRVRPGRRSGGKLTVRAKAVPGVQHSAAAAAVRERLEPITGPFALKPRVRMQTAEGSERVQ